MMLFFGSSRFGAKQEQDSTGPRMKCYLIRLFKNSSFCRLKHPIQQNLRLWSLEP
jgi:hypothetical protein